MRGEHVSDICSCVGERYSGVREFERVARKGKRVGASRAFQFCNVMCDASMSVIREIYHRIFAKVTQC